MQMERQTPPQRRQRQLTLSFKVTPQSPIPPGLPVKPRQAGPDNRQLATATSHIHQQLQRRESGPVIPKSPQRRISKSQKSRTMKFKSWSRLSHTPQRRLSSAVWQDAVGADLNSLYTSGVEAIGKLFFRSDEENELNHEPARFASFRFPGTDAEAVVKVLLSYWRIKQPSMLLSITGSSQALDLEPRLEALIKEGLLLAARSTRAWMITGGTDTGVMELAGKALLARSTNVQGEKSRWITPLIGVAPMHKVTNHEGMREAKPEPGQQPPLRPYFKVKKNSEESAALDPNHSHFVLVDNDENKGWGGEIEMRGLIEKRLSEKLALPMVCIVVQGGKGTVYTVLQAFKHNCPIGACPQRALRRSHAPGPFLLR